MTQIFVWCTCILIFYIYSATLYLSIGEFKTFTLKVITDSESENVGHSVVSDSLWPIWLLHPWDSSDKNTRVGCHALLPGFFLTQGLNPDLLHCRQILFHLSYQEALTIFILLIVFFVLQFICSSFLFLLPAFMLPWCSAVTCFDFFLIFHLYPMGIFFVGRLHNTVYSYNNLLN